MALKETGGATATEEGGGETASMFPDLDMADPKHRALVKAAKDFSKAKKERDELLSTAKEKMDARGENLTALMHEAKMTKFKFDGVKAEIIPSREKVQVRIDPDDEESDSDD